MIPNSEDKDQIKTNNQASKWYYNLAVDVLERNRDKWYDLKLYNRKKLLNYKRIRDLCMKYRYIEDRSDNIVIQDFEYDEDCHEFPRPDWFKGVHSRVIRGAILNCVTNYNSCISNKRNGNIKSYNMRYRTKKDKNDFCLFEDERYPVFINNLKGYYRYGRKRIPFKDILNSTQNRGLTLQYEKLTRRYYVLYPVEASWTPIDLDESQVRVNRDKRYSFISLDTGVRTFQTGYCPDGHTINIGEQDCDSIFKLLKRIDRLQSIISTISNPQKRWTVIKKRKKVSSRVKNLITDLHWKVIKYLTDQYKVVMIPTFHISDMVKGKISKKTKRLLYIFRHYEFRKKLLYKASLTDTKVLIVDESYTSKTCTHCGYIHTKLGSNKCYKCPSCNFTIDRDVNGARNILLKNSIPADADRLT